MESLSGQVLKGFNVKTKNIRRVKGYYTFTQNEKKYIIRKSSDTIEHIHFQNDVKTTLIRHGFDCIDKFYPSAQNKPYFICDNAVFIMTDYLGDTVDFTDKNMTAHTIKTVARFHQNCENGLYSGALFYGQNLADKFSVAKKEMQSIKNRLKIQGRLSDFDILFIKNYNYYYDMILSAAEIIQHTEYAQKYKAAVCDKQICHNAFKKDHIFFKEGKIYLTNFSACLIDYYIWDLAELISRYKKYDAQCNLSILEIIGLYDAVKGLTADDCAILYACLLYPAGFLKAVRQYYTKKRTWAPSSIMNRMQSVIDDQDRFGEFITPIRV